MVRMARIKAAGSDKSDDYKSLGKDIRTNLEDNSFFFVRKNYLKNRSLKYTERNIYLGPLIPGTEERTRIRTINRSKLFQVCDKLYNSHHTQILKGNP